MNVVTVSKMRDNLSNTLSKVTYDEAITIQKNSKDIAVIISSTRYKELQCIEDLLYKKAADIAFAEGFASQQETEKLLAKIRSDA